MRNREELMLRRQARRIERVRVGLLVVLELVITLHEGRVGRVGLIRLLYVEVLSSWLRIGFRGP